MEDPRKERFEGVLSQLETRYKSIFNESLYPALISFLEEELKDRRRIALKESLSHLEPQDLLFLFQLALKKGPGTSFDKPKEDPVFYDEKTETFMPVTNQVFHKDNPLPEEAPVKKKPGRPKRL